MHIAIVVTSWNPASIASATSKAESLGLQVIGPSAPIHNGISSILVCPDGLKEAGDKRAAFDIARRDFMEFLGSIRYEDGSSDLRWVVAEYPSSADDD